MISNVFAWWPTVSETPEQFSEKQDWLDKDKQFNMPKQTLYWEFKPKINQTVEVTDNPELVKSESNIQKQPEWEDNISGWENTEQEIPEQEKLDLSKFKENPNYPILERFTQIQWNNWEPLESTQLKNKDLIEISKVLDKNEWDKDPLEYLKANLWKIDFENPKTSDFLSSYIDKIIDLNKDKNEQVVDKWDDKWSEKLELPDEFKNNNVLNNENDDVVQLLVKNHKKLPDLKNWEPNFDKDILTTFEVTANKIIDWKNLPRNESFNIAMNDVKHWDMETRYKALTYINRLVNTIEWVKSESSELSYDNIESENESDNQEDIEFEITKLNEQLIIAKDSWDNKKIKELQLEISKLEDKKSSWDVFESWAIDRISENDPLISEKK